MQGCVNLLSLMTEKRASQEVVWSFIYVLAHLVRRLEKRDDLMVHILIDLKYGGVVRHSVVSIGRAEYCYNLTIVLPLIPILHDLMPTTNEAEIIRVTEMGGCLLVE
jgi:hypothetical protein